MSTAEDTWGKYLIEVYIRGRPVGESSTITGTVRFWRIHGNPGTFDEQILICGYCHGFATHQEMTTGVCRKCDRPMDFNDIMAIKSAETTGGRSVHCAKCHQELTPKTVQLRLLCPSCKQQFVPGKLHDAKVYAETPRKLADQLHQMIVKMGLMVSIKIVRDRTDDDIRRLSLDHTGLTATERVDRLDMVRSSREEAIYPRNRIEADLAKGSSLEDVLVAFLTA